MTSPNLLLASGWVMRGRQIRPPLRRSNQISTRMICLRVRISASRGLELALRVPFSAVFHVVSPGCRLFPPRVSAGLFELVRRSLFESFFDCGNHLQETWMILFAVH